MTDIADTIQQLRPLRPRTAPQSDINAERNAILSFTTHPLVLIQIAIGVVLIALAGYVVLETEKAHWFAALVLSGGVAIAFLARK